MKSLETLLILFLTTGAVILTGAVLSRPSARADTAMSWDLDICSKTLQSAHACTAAAPVEVTATLNTAKTKIFITVSVATNFALWGNGIFGFNWSGPKIVSRLMGSTGPSAPYILKIDKSGTEDGFGTMTNSWDFVPVRVKAVDAGPKSLMFGVLGKGLSFSDFVPDSKGFIFAAHVAALRLHNVNRKPTTGYVGAAAIASVKTPEPVTPMLVGAGLIGLVAVRRARRREQGRRSPESF